MAHAGKLLRRPLPPKVLPPVLVDRKSIHETKNNNPNSLINLFEPSFNLDALQHIEVDLDVSTEEVDQDYSFICPPPSSDSDKKRVSLTQDIHNGLLVQFKQNVASLGTSNIFADELKYMLDPNYTRASSVPEPIKKSCKISSLKPRGPDPLPSRSPKRNSDILIYPSDDDVEERYMQQPSFVLDHFLYKLAEQRNLALPTLRSAVYSRHSVRKLTQLLASQLNRCAQDSVHNLTIDLSEIPQKENRVPKLQLLCEMAALMKAHVQEAIQAKVKPVIKFHSKLRQDFSGWGQREAEIILYQEDSEMDTPLERRARQETDLQRQSYPRETELPERDALFHSAYSRYFQGVKRSRSPVSFPEEETVLPSELAVLDSLMTGGITLSFKAHFIQSLPDISPLTFTLTQLNLCFNNLQTFPEQVLQVKNLEVLKMRNNPLMEIPGDIDQLQKLKIFSAPFCLITSLPKSLCYLPCLEELCVAYNSLTQLPTDMGRLQALKVLDIEGNQISALPASCLTMKHLAHINVRNNLMHPLLRTQNTGQQIQSLLDLACMEMSKQKMRYSQSQDLTDGVTRMLAREETCDVCKGPLFGPGLRIIRPVVKMFSVKYLPVMFRACRPGCLDSFTDMSAEQLQELVYGL